MKFLFSIAEKKDDPELRKIMAAIPMEGNLTATFEREPDYFLGCSAMGRDCKVLIAREEKSGKLAMTACTAVTHRFINGEVQPVGYLGQLRVAAPFQGLMLPSRGAAFLQKEHKTSKAVLWFSAIADQNTAARTIFVDHPRKIFPRMRKAAGIKTLGIFIRKKKQEKPAGYHFHEGSRENLRDIVYFLNTWGREKQFYPAYTEDDFLDNLRTRSFSLGDFRILKKGKRIAGVAGLWDQSSYKQTVVRNYRGFLKYCRPAYNLFAPLLDIPSLPGKGEKLNSAYASFICTEENSPAVFRIVLNEIYNCACDRGFHYLMAGFSENDPLLPVAEEFLHISYDSSIYVFSMNGSTIQPPVLDGRIPCIEIAAL